MLIFSPCLNFINYAMTVVPYYIYKILYFMWNISVTLLPNEMIHGMSEWVVKVFMMAYSPKGIVSCDIEDGK